MADFRFLRVPGTDKWVISDPNRAKRPNAAWKAVAVCPFCVGREGQELEVYREGGSPGDTNWHIRVIKNKFPFTSVHEIVIHSPDHHRNFEELPLAHIELILKTYRLRYEEHRKKGQVYIFHNRGIAGGESIPHPHSQITVVPFDVRLDIQPLDGDLISRRFNSENSENSVGQKTVRQKNQIIRRLVKTFSGILKLRVTDNLISPSILSVPEILETKHFMIFCPESSQWSDEVWIAPQRANMHFGDINDGEIADLAFCLQRLINILDLRHGHEFAFNFYIYPGKNWYLRILPRHKILGGFEMGTGVIVNTQDPRATFAFIKEHFFEPDLYKIRLAQQEDYWKSV